MTYIKETKVVWLPDKSADAVIRLTERMEILSSAPLNGGSVTADTLFIMQVPHDFCCEDFDKYLIEKRDSLGLPEDQVGFMTAAEVGYVFSTAEEEYGGEKVFVAGTAGVTNAVCAGDELTDWERKAERSAEITSKLLAGTINLLLVSPHPLTMEAKINMLMPAIEGKAMGMHDAGYVETGTTSDAIAVICPIGEKKVQFAGTGTQIGISAAKGVRKVLTECLRKRGERPEGRSALQMLYDRGATPELVWECAVALGLNEEAKEDFDSTMEDMSSDPDICAVMAGMMWAAYFGERDCICGQYEGDMPMCLEDGSWASFLASRISEDRGRDRVVDLMSMSPLSDSGLPEYVRQAVYGLVAGVAGFVTGFSDE